MRSPIAPRPFASICLLAIGIGVISVYAQNGPTTPPVSPQDEDPAIWWTLTDEVTPEELKASFADTAGHRERYREAIRAGLREPMPEDQIAHITYFVDGATHPHLLQMQVAFSSFATGVSMGPEGYGFDKLVDFGFEAEIAQRICTFSEVFDQERDELLARIEEETRPASQFHERARERMDPQSFDAAHRNNDYDSFARATGHSVAEVRRFFEQINQKTVLELQAQTLRILKESLRPDDWERFRAFLLEVQAPKISGLGVADAGGN